MVLSSRRSLTHSTLRDLICGKMRFSQFLDSPERITPSVLTNRLTFLEADGLIFRRSYSERPKRYEFFVTPKGEALLSVMQAICAWGHVHVPGTWEAPRVLWNAFRA
jgi:DNA-binding HxlR family transcriptional regulator